MLIWQFLQSLEIMVKYVYHLNRFYIHESKKDEFVNLFLKLQTSVDKTKKLKNWKWHGSKYSIRSINNFKKRLNEIEENWLKKQNQEGAKVLLGGKRPTKPWI